MIASMDESVSTRDEMKLMRVRNFSLACCILPSYSFGRSRSSYFEMLLVSKSRNGDENHLFESIFE